MISELMWNSDSPALNGELEASEESDADQTLDLLILKNTWIDLVLFNVNVLFG